MSGVLYVMFQARQGLHFKGPQRTVAFVLSSFWSVYAPDLKTPRRNELAPMSSFQRGCESWLDVGKALGREPGRGPCGTTTTTQFLLSSVPWVPGMDRHRGYYSVSSVVLRILCGVGILECPAGTKLQVLRVQCTRTTLVPLGTASAKAYQVSYSY